MRVVQAALAGTATIVAVPEQQLLVVDEQLDRNEAAMAVQGVLPETHPDVVDHWLDQVYDRPRRALSRWALSAVLLFGGGFGISLTAHHHAPLTRETVASRVVGARGRVQTV